MISKVEEEAEAEEETQDGEEEELPPRRPPRLDHDPLPDYPAYRRPLPEYPAYPRPPLHRDYACISSSPSSS